MRNRTWSMLFQIKFFDDLTLILIQLACGWLINNDDDDKTYF